MADQTFTDGPVLSVTRAARVPNLRDLARFRNRNGREQKR
jgi:hypothetical protein